MNLSIILGAIGPMQIVLILLVIILLFGGKKLPELMKGIGEGLKEFKKATKQEDTTTNK
jgi:sec-independent protein translocase protein TatA